MPTYRVSYPIDGYISTTVEAADPKAVVAEAGKPPDWAEALEWEIEIGGCGSPEIEELDVA